LILMASFMIVQAYASFLPEEVPLPSNPDTSQKADVGLTISSEKVDLSSLQAWQIIVPSTPTAARRQVTILRTGGLPAYIQTQGNQTLVVVGPELNKTSLQQEQKIVLELLHTSGTIVPYQVMS